MAQNIAFGDYGSENDAILIFFFNSFPKHLDDPQDNSKQDYKDNLQSLSYICITVSYMIIFFYEWSIPVLDDLVSMVGLLIRGKRSY